MRSSTWQQELDTEIATEAAADRAWLRRQAISVVIFIAVWLLEISPYVKFVAALSNLLWNTYTFLPQILHSSRVPKFATRDDKQPVEIQCEEGETQMIIPRGDSCAALIRHVHAIRNNTRPLHYLTKKLRPERLESNTPIDRLSWHYRRSTGRWCVVII
jgi:hypothetical protein